MYVKSVVAYHSNFLQQKYFSRLLYQSASWSYNWVSPLISLHPSHAFFLSWRVSSTHTTFLGWIIDFDSLLVKGGSFGGFYWPLSFALIALTHRLIRQRGAFYYLRSICRLILFSVNSELTINCIHRLPVDRPRSEGDLSPDIFILILTYNGLNLGLNQSLLPKVLVSSFPQCIQ